MSLKKKYRFITLVVTALFSLLAVGPVGASSSNETNPESLLRNGRADDAIKVLQKTLNEGNQDAGQSHNLLCRVYIGLGKLDPAIKECEMAVKSNPSNGAYHLWLGRAYGNKAEKANPFAAIGLAKKARENFEKAVELNGDDVLARTDLAEFYIESPGIVGGGQDKARAQADSIAAHDEAAAYWVKARLDEKAKNYPSGEENYKAALKASNNDAWGWVNLASFYRRQGRLTEMDDAIRKAASAHKTRTNVFVDAASLLIRTGRSLPDAASLLVKYLSSSTTKDEDAPTFRAHFMLGQVMEKQGNKADATKEYEAALQLASDYQPARDALKRVNGK